MKEKYFTAIWNDQIHIFVCILVSQTPNQNGMKRQGKPLPSWARICQVSAWEKFVAWSYKPLKIGVYNGSAILTLSVVALLLCYNISSPSICEIVICPMAGNWGDDETQGYALNYLNLSVLGFYWHIKREGEQGARGWCQLSASDVLGRKGNRAPDDCLHQSPDYLFTPQYFFLSLQQTWNKFVHDIWSFHLQYLFFSLVDLKASQCRTSQSC